MGLNQNWEEEKKEEKLRNYRKTCGKVRHPATACLSLRGFVFVVLLTGSGPRRSETAAPNSVSGGGRGLEAKAKVTRDATMK